MTFANLKDFLLRRMSMSHIYQPLVIRTLLENNGEASVRQIAREFLSYDEAQVEYYCKIVKRWPKITLRKHGIIDASRRGFFRLNINLDKLSGEQRKELIEICNDKIKDYISNYKGIIGDYRYNPDNLSSSSIRYLVLKMAHGRCALCGASIKDTPIDIDHIIPRNKGGSNDISNLQALCYRCNRAKRDRDEQDFRDFGINESVKDCDFCDLNDRVIYTCNTAHYIRDAFPITQQHSLIVPRRHVTTINDLPAVEIGDLFRLAKIVKVDLQHSDKTITGFNLGFNEGISAGQTMAHLHLHIIPRRQGDVADPQGGIRGIIPGIATEMLRGGNTK
ncbi:MAG: HIT domain-containing protein [Blastocatellia bacterium]|nr:HIT domain-containing protein [Blastocatellia bacterium]